MSDLAADKRLVVAFLHAMADAEADDIGLTLQTFCHDDAIWRIFHPVGEVAGREAVEQRFWRPLKIGFPDHEQRIGQAIAGMYEGRACVSTLGNLQGTFAEPWLGIPPTYGLILQRFGFCATVHGGKIASAWVLLDVLDVMLQAGVYPLRRMPGSAAQWPLPPAESGASLSTCDPAWGAETLQIVWEMQTGLAKGDDLKALAKLRGNHSPHWHDNMNWYGPAGIGSSRGQRGFLDYHGALFIQAFPDRGGIARTDEGDEGRPGSYMSIGDGPFAVTTGYPLMHGTHLGGAWLGVPPSGRAVTMRVADWYRADADGKLIDNWVMIDLLDILHQFGLDVLDDLRFFADPTLPRWPTA